jgi:hypothetical protein
MIFSIGFCLLQDEKTIKIAAERRVILFMGILFKFKLNFMVKPRVSIFVFRAIIQIYYFQLNFA